MNLSISLSEVTQDYNYYLLPASIDPIVIGETSTGSKFLLVKCDSLSQISSLDVCHHPEKCEQNRKWKHVWELS